MRTIREDVRNLRFGQPTVNKKYFAIFLGQFCIIKSEILGQPWSNDPTANNVRDISALFIQKCNHKLSEVQYIIEYIAYLVFELENEIFVVIAIPEATYILMSLVWCYHYVSNFVLPSGRPKRVNTNTTETKILVRFNQTETKNTKPELSVYFWEIK